MNQLSLSKLNPAQIETAISKYLRLIATSPQPAEVHANLGSLYAQQQQWQDALSCYEQALNLDSDCAGVYRNLAKIHTQMGDERKAADNLYQAFKLEPTCATSEQYYLLGKSLQSQKKPGRAIACYRRAIQFQPDFWAAYNCLGQFLSKQGKDELALEVYRQGVKCNPQNAQFHLSLGQALAAKKEWIEAGSCYERALKLDQSMAVGYYSWGLALSQVEKWLQARECHQKAIHLQPNYWEAHHQLGIIWQQQHQWEKAIAAYQKVRVINPQFAPAPIRMGLLYRRLKKYKLAIESYGQAINIAPESSPMEQEAIDGYEKTIADSPQPKAALYYQLGRLLRAKSLFPNALCAYQKAIELDPKFQSAYIDIQYTPIAPEQLTGLIEFYRQIVKDHPKIPIAWGNLGDALTEQGRVSEAIECYNKSCYQKTINLYPHLAQLDWKDRKEYPPDFIVVGAAKCGTSSLHHYLSRHPQILLPHKKEIDFFWKNFDRGLDWYLAHFPTITDRPDFITGEATPNYLRFPLVAQRIKGSFPKVKIIILLRNPIDRAVSWHYHKVNSGLAIGDLAQVVASEMARLATLSESDFINTGYYNPDNLLSSLYIYQIKVWMELLGREQFLILKSEEFYSNPDQEMAKVLAFLGLPNCPLDKYPQVNEGSYDAVEPKLRKTLADYFHPYNQQLEEYLGIKFDWN
jgi:tetratricopeptide (TPR) repeat protein